MRKGKGACERMKRPVVLIGGIGILVALLLATLSVYFYGPSTSVPILLFIAAIVGSFLRACLRSPEQQP